MNSRASIIALLLLNVAVVACEDEIVSSPPPPPERRPAPVVSASASSSAASASLGLGEADFTRTDVNRDPFYSYLDAAKVDKPATRNTALADEFSLDELKLVGIITGNAAARAMFVDPKGKGWIVTTGQLVGRAEVVKSGGGMGAEYELNWKVDRIRNNDVVFIRETPGRPNVPSATRVITLRTEEQNAPPARR